MQQSRISQSIRNGRALAREYSIRLGIATAVALLGSACSFTPSSSLPGGGTDPITLEPIPVSTVLSALKCQIEKGLIGIAAQKRGIAGKEAKENKSPRESIFELKKGTAVFSGKTTVVGTDDGDISIVIPVGISELTPNLGGKLTTTATEEITRTFGVGVKLGASICDHLAKTNRNIAIGTFISDRMLAAFNDSLDVPVSATNKSFGPALTEKELTIKANFSVQRVLGAGVKADVLFSANNTSSPTLKPTIAFVNDAKGEYSISLTFPMSAPDTGNDQRFYQCVRTRSGGTY